MKNSIGTRRKGIKVEYHGVSYKSINEACKELGIIRTTISTYMNKGYTFEQAVDACLLIKKHNEEVEFRKLREQEDKQNRILSMQICINGVVYRNIKEACELLGISANTVRKYVREKGITHEEAILLLINKINSGNTRIGAQRKTRLNEASIARQYGLKDNDIAKYRNKHNDYETPADIIANRIRDYRTNSKNNRYIINEHNKKAQHERDIKYPNITKYARSTGIGRYKMCVYAEKHPELTEEQVIELFKRGGQRNNIGDITVKDEHTIIKDNGLGINFKGLCKELELDYDTVKYYKESNNVGILESIMAFKYGSYINWLGELVITN